MRHTCTKASKALQTSSAVTADRMCIDTFVNMCVDMRVEMWVRMCIDMRVDVCVDMCMGVCIDMCVDMCLQTPSAVYGRVHRHVHLHA